MIITLWWGYLLAHPATLFIWGALAAACVLALAAYLRLTSEQGAHHASRPEPRSRAGRMTRAGRWALVAASRLPGAITTHVPGRDGASPAVRCSARRGPAALAGNRHLHATDPAGGHHTWTRKAIGHRIQALRKWSWIAREGAAARLPGRLASHVDPFCRGMRRYLRRRTIARRIQALRTWWAFTRPRRQPSTEERQAMALLQQMRDEDTGGFLALPGPGVTVKIGAADVRAAGRTLGMPVAPPGLCPDCARDMDAEQHQIGCPGLDEPLPPDPCSYQPAPPLAAILSDETIARGMAAITGGA